MKRNDSPSVRRRMREWLPATISAVVCSTLMVTGLGAQTTNPVDDPIDYHACYLATPCPQVATCPGWPNGDECYQCQHGRSQDLCEFNLFADCLPFAYTNPLDCGRMLTGTCVGGVCMLDPWQNLFCARVSCYTL